MRGRWWAAAVALGAAISFVAHYDCSVANAATTHEELRPKFGLSFALEDVAVSHDAADVTGLRPVGNLSQRKFFLPFSGVGASRSGISRTTLFYEVVGLTFVGLVFATAGAFGLVWALYDPNWKAKLAGCLIASAGLFGTIFFYGWAAFLHPLHMFGLA